MAVHCGHGLLEALATLGIFLWALNHRDLVGARGLAFSTLVFSELFRAFAARSTNRLFWEVGAFTNLRLLAVVGLSALLQLTIHQIPAAQAVFGIGALSAADCALAVPRRARAGLGDRTVQTRAALENRPMIPRRVLGRAIGVAS